MKFLKEKKIYEFYLSLFLFTAVCVCAILFIYYEIAHNSTHKTLGYLHQFLAKLPNVNPRKAAILLYGLQNDVDNDDDDRSFVERLPPKIMDELRRTLMDPRSFLMTSYGTHLGRPDYIDASTHDLK
uniref:Wsv136-like protein n=2 Tax=unclassified Nimaviridae TaxID=2133791 RepID=A0A9C7BQ92_9VIRU|nr:MAG: wsv136-like protein [Marsupenaeus japonicus endogenous nimavirus]BDT62370.1 MAG: wsv136-like protein [Melicertus latisulcatus majanivirus]GBG35422.1 wsv136-like protein [Marsupenaeus japonicus endogenous nimavirus]